MLFSLQPFVSIRYFVLKWLFVYLRLFLPKSEANRVGQACFNVSELENSANSANCRCFSFAPTRFLARLSFDFFLFYEFLTDFLDLRSLIFGFFNDGRAPFAEAFIGKVGFALVDCWFSVAVFRFMVRMFTGNYCWIDL